MSPFCRAQLLLPDRHPARTRCNGLHCAHQTGSKTQPSGVHNQSDQLIIVFRSSRFRHQLRHVGHGVWLAISYGASTEVIPAIRITIAFHALGDLCPVVDFGLIHRTYSIQKFWKLRIGLVTVLSRDDRHPTLINAAPSGRSSPPRRNHPLDASSYLKHLQIPS